MLVITFKNFGSNSTCQEFPQLNPSNSFLKIQNDYVCIYQNHEIVGIYKDFVSIFYAEDQNIKDEER